MYDVVEILGFLVVCLTLFLAWRSKVGTSANPAGVILAWIIITIGFDAVYIYANKHYGHSTQNTFPLRDSLLGDAVTLWLVFTITLFATHYLSNIALRIHNFSNLKSEFVPDIKSLKSIELSVIICGLISFSTSFFILLKSGGLGNWGSISAQRNLIFSDGGGYLLILLQLLKFAVLYYFGCKYKSGSTPGLTRAVAYIAPVIIIDLMFGMRSAMLYSFLLPLIILRHNMYKKYKISQIILGATAIILVLGVGYRTWARDLGYSYNYGRSFYEVATESLSNLPEYVWGGFEAASLDGTMGVLDEPGIRNAIPYNTIWAGMVSIIPRTVWEDKPVGGGNTMYTIYNYPDFYQKNRAEYSVSFVGELWMNGGIWLVFLGAMAIGFFMSFTQKVHSSLSYHHSVLFWIVIIRILSLLRGDLYAFIGQWTPMIIAYTFVVLCSRIVKPLAQHETQTFSRALS